MPKGGRRFGNRDAPKIEPCSPPPPPKDSKGVTREAWLELRRQVEEARTYNPTRFTAFRLAVLAVAAVYEAPLGTKATTMRSLIETASKLISRFGLDPIGVAQADAAPEAPKPSALDEFS